MPGHFSWIITSLLILFAVSAHASDAPLSFPAAATSAYPNQVPFDPNGYKTARPNLALEISYSPDTFSNSPTFANSTVTVNTFSFLFEYQPRFVQKYGVLGIGALTGVYLTSPSGVVTQSGLDFYSIGAELRYQARYYQEQVVVPFIGYSMEYFHYHIINATVQTLTEEGPMLGLMFLLNAIDPKSTKDLYKSSRISRTYFVVEARGSSSGDETIPWTPKAWFFGLRMEL